MQRITLETDSRIQAVEITSLIEKHLTKNSWHSGALVVYSPHTTGSITVNENADPDVRLDINEFLKKLIPRDGGFRHSEGNADAHIKGTLTGFSHTFIVENGTLQLGTWQGIYFMEFDGPRNREVWLKFIPDK